MSMAQYEALRLLGCSDEEAKQVIEDDKRIDKGEDLFPLGADQKAVVKEMAQADRKKETAKRERKVDADKHELFQVLDDALCDIADDVKVLTADRELLCVFNDKTYKITLSCPRK